MEESARRYVNYARQLASSGYYSKSFELYVTAFEKCPEVKDMFELEFRYLLTRLNDILVSTGKVEQVFTNFERATVFFPDNIHLINVIGKYLYNFSYYFEAWSYFQKALKLNPGFVNPEKNLNSLKNALLERWHFRMLNDKVRNEAYHKAIHRTVIPNRDSVFDVGTGTGILAIYANECLPVTIAACDHSKIMVKLAECIMEENLIQDILLLNMNSDKISESDINGKCSVLITEMFDSGLFGEHVLQMLIHAWEHLIKKDGKVLPSKAEFFVMGAQSEHIKIRFQLGEYAKQLLNIPLSNVHIMADVETNYDCEDICLIKDTKYLTEPQSLLKVDFNNYNDLQEILNKTEPYNLNINVKEDGELNVVVGWFNLHLTDSITITTDPRAKRRATAWQQALFFDYSPRTVKKDQKIEFQFKINDGKLNMIPDVSEIDRISPEALRFLNDTDYIKMIKGCIGMACVYLGQIAEISEIMIVDLCPFPIFGLLMLQRGIKSLTCAAKTENDQQFFMNVFKANNIPLSKISFLVGDEWNKDVFENEKFHAVFSNILELFGDVDVRLKEISLNLKHVHLLQGGLFLPSKITLIGQLINSRWLDITNRVYDENVHYKMAKFVNMYQVSQVFCVDYVYLEHISLSEPEVLSVCSDSMRPEVINIPVTNDGEANAILCWFTIELFEDYGEISTNRSNSYIDSMAYLADPKVPMMRGDIANILLCVDVDGAYKLMIDVDTR